MQNRTCRPSKFTEVFDHQTSVPERYIQTTIVADRIQRQTCQAEIPRPPPPKKKRTINIKLIPKIKMSTISKKPVKQSSLAMPPTSSSLNNVTIVDDTSGSIFCNMLQRYHGRIPQPRIGNDATLQGDALSCFCSSPSRQQLSKISSHAPQLPQLPSFSRRSDSLLSSSEQTYCHPRNDPAWCSFPATTLDEHSEFQRNTSSWPDLTPADAESHFQDLEAVTFHWDPEHWPSNIPLGFWRPYARPSRYRQITKYGTAMRNHWETKQRMGRWLLSVQRTKDVRLERSEEWDEAMGTFHWWEVDRQLRYHEIMRISTERDRCMDMARRGAVGY